MLFSDFEKAAGLFDKAATAFRNAKLFEKSQHASTEAGNCHYANDAPFSAGRSFEHAAQMAIELKKSADAVPLLKRAANCFREDGKADKGAEVLVKAAQTLGDADVDAALELFGDAVEILADDDKDFKAGPTYKLAISFALQHQQPKLAIDMLKRQIVAAAKLDHKHQVHKCHLSIILVLLHQDDLVGAQAYQADAYATDVTGYPGSDDCALAVRILSAFEARDQEALTAAINEQHITFLDNQVTKLAKKLTVSEIEL